MAQKVGAPREWYRITAKAEADVAEIWIYGEIGVDFWTGEGISAKALADQIYALPAQVRTIRVHVSSTGGNPFEAIAIANTLREQSRDKGRTVEMLIESAANSAASIVTCAGDVIKIASNAIMVIHNPQAPARGDSRAHRSIADKLDAIRDIIVATYRWVSQLSVDEIRALMDAETWMGAEEAVANGFATEIMEAFPVTACLDPQSIKALGEIPEQYRERVAALIAKPEPVAPAEPVAEPAAPGVMVVKAGAVSAEAIKALEEEPGIIVLLSPQPADPSAVLAACETAGCLDLARVLIDAKATTEQVTARLQRAKEVRALCAMAKCPELAGDYITADVPVATVKAQLTKITAKQDRIEIDASLSPDAGGAARTARLNPSAIYAERNARAGQRGA